MDNNLLGFIKGLFVLRWKPGKDLVVVCFSWILVVASLYLPPSLLAQIPGEGFLISYFTSLISV